jgi:hypothetical protein
LLRVKLILSFEHPKKPDGHWTLVIVFCGSGT